MKKILLNFYHKKIVFYSFIVLLAIGLYVIFFIEKEALHLTINSFHSPFWDFFFKYTTYLGDGIIFPIVILGLLLFKRKYATSFLYAGLLCLIISYSLKQWVFVGYPRPYEVFGEILYLVEGVKMRHWHSFPSGHTLSAFALFTLAILYSKKNISQILFMSLAIIAGISRVYLSQHFFIDVIGGAIIGVLIALTAHLLAENYSLFKK